MINNKELEISNKSYTNKDFPAIYAELLDLVKQLTSKWDPATSNESDPGIVLMKLTAFIADKLNYNIDKNTLERFLLSATQAKSMRELCDMLGYNMNYYVSAQTEITFIYTGQKDGEGNEKLGDSDWFIIPAFTAITSDDGNVHYLTTSDATISRATDYSDTVPAIEGELNTLVVNDTDIITLSNLDDNLRVYFPVPNVAQNGVVIKTIATGKSWDIVDNLNTEALGQNIYKFGFDSVKGKAYVEFPKDISSLIKSGLSIQYITTTGADGNVKARFLTTLENTTEFAINGDPTNTISFTNEGNDGLVILNYSSSINGANPESINDAYNNYKKTVGTFNTLVTCRDYANYIYNMTDLDGFPYVSNVQVTDRRDDVNYAIKVVSFNDLGMIYTTQAQTDKTITPYDLCLYPLNKIVSYTDTGRTQYIQSFQPLGSTSAITTKLENSKSISHDYKSLSGDDIYLIKNYLRLNATISTKDKVYAAEQADILRNIEMALVENFNARKVDYGYEIPYDTLLQVIQGADERISTVSLAEPELKTSVMTAGGSESLFIDSTQLNTIAKIIALNVLSGRVPLFEYDNDFAYEFGQEQISGKEMKMDDLATISTEAAITLSDGEDYGIRENEVIQAYAPSYITTDTYPVYVLFSFFSPFNRKIEDGTIYKLRENEFLYITYTENGAVHTEIYDEDKIFQPKGFDMYPTVLGKTGPGGNYNNPEYWGQQVLKSFNAEDLGSKYNKIDQSKIAKTQNVNPNQPNYKEGPVKAIFNSLGAEQSIEIKKKNEVPLTKPTYCYWIRNNAHNKLFLGTETSIILDDGEYFFYTDSNFTNLYEVGSGTTITRSSLSDITTTTNWEADILSYADIEEKGLLSLRDSWVKVNIVNNASVLIEENSILTLTTGDSIRLDSLYAHVEGDTAPTWEEDTYYTLEDGVYVLQTEEPEDWDTDYSNYYEKTFTSVDLDNTLKGVTASISYVIGEQTDSLSLFDIDNVTWKLKSRLDINAGPSLSQVLYSGHTVTFVDKDGNELELNSDENRFNLNMLKQFAGGENIDVSDYDFITGETNPLAVYCYNVDDTYPSIIRDGEGYLSLDFLAQEHSTYTYTIPVLSGEKSILMVYWKPNAATGNTITVKLNTNITPKKYNSSDTIGTLTTEGIYCIDLDKESYNNTDISSITFTQYTGEGILIVDRLKYFTGFNPLLDLDNSELPGLGDVVLDILSEYNDKFYYTNAVHNDIALNLDKYTPITSPYAFYDSNNIFNKFTISEIDFGNSLISIARSSRK